MVEWSEPAILNHRASVHDHKHACRTGAGRRVVIDNAELRPKDTDTEPDSLIDELRQVTAVAEDVDHVERRGIGQPGYNRPSVDCLACQARIDGRDVEPALQ